MKDILKETDPEIPLMLAELQDCLANSGAIVRQQEIDWRTRMAVWEGQSDDGRKWKEKLGADPMPWNGASDQRVRAVDEVINEQVALMAKAFSQASIQVTSNRGDSMGASTLVNYILTWLFKVHLKAEFEREIELYSNWRQQYGHAIMGIYWQQERQMTREQIDLKKMFSEAEGDPQALTSFALLMEKLADPLAEPEMLDFIRSYSDAITPAKARAVLKDLREVGAAEVPRETLISSLPCWEALRPFIDVFYPVSTPSLQKARWVARVEWISETELRERIDTDDYAQEFVDAAILSKGKVWQGHDLALSLNWNLERRGGSGFCDDYRDLIQIFHVFRRGTEEKTGVPAIYNTVISPHVVGLCAKHGPSQYKHGRMPFVEGVREHVGRAMSESRSVSEVGRSAQDVMKGQTDARTDYTSIATIPPVIVPPNRGKTRLEFGPGVQHTERRPNEIRWMQPPQGNLTASVEVERSAQERLDRYFGRFSPTVSPVLSQLLQGHMVNKFLTEVVEMAKQTVQLAQQYLPETTVERITGGHRVPFNLSRDEIQGQFDIAITFDVANLDRATLSEKLDFLDKVLRMDTQGLIDRAGAVKWALGSYDPALAQALIGDPAAAAANEADDEKKNFTMINAGVEPPMRESGQNFQLRLQTLMGIVQQNPEALKDLQSRPDRQAIWDNRVKHLQFMIQQQQNAATGRTGAEPLMQ